MPGEVATLTAPQPRGLLLLGARVYHAELKRWLQPDTVDGRRFTYTGGDPRNFTDPSGRMRVPAGMAEMYYRLFVGDPSALGSWNLYQGGMVYDARVANTLAAIADLERDKREHPEKYGMRRVDGFSVIKVPISTNFSVALSDPASNQGTEYGHWFEILGPNESYGFWPTDPVDLWGTLFGVDGSVNRGEANDPDLDGYLAGGMLGAERFDLYVPAEITDDKVRQLARDYQEAFRSKWSYPFGNNCHTFLDGFLEKNGFVIVPHPSRGRGSGVQP